VLGCRRGDSIEWPLADGRTAPFLILAVTLPRVALARRDDICWNIEGATRIGCSRDDQAAGLVRSAAFDSATEVLR